MNHKQLFITVSCLLLFAASGMAEQPAEPTQEEVWLMQRQMHMQSGFAKGAIRLFWEGRGTDIMAMQYMGHPIVREAWGLSDEHLQQVAEQINSRTQSLMPEFEATDSAFLETLMSRLTAIQETFPEGWQERQECEELIKELTPRIQEMQDIAQDIQREALEVMASMKLSVQVDAVDYILTPEQKRTVQETLLANMDVLQLPIFLAQDVFEALDLTDAQKEQMATIRREFKPEFENILDQFVNTILNPQDHTAFLSKFNTQMFDVLTDEQMAFYTKFKTQIFDVLTDEQWFRLQNLIDNPPEHALAFRNIFREQRGESGDSEEASGVWMPGPNSWRPGDAIPEAYRIERNTRRQFPRGEE